MDFGLIFLLVFIILIIIIYGIVWGIISFINFISKKKHKRWCDRVFNAHPELKVLLSNYNRLRREYCQTTRELVELQKTIDAWIEKDKYTPMSRRLFTHIENLKEQYQELLEIEQEQNNLAKEAREELIEFWKVNYPNLPEHKRLIYWRE